MRPPPPPRTKPTAKMAVKCGVSQHVSCPPLASGADATSARPQLWLPPPSWSVSRAGEPQRQLAVSAVPPRRHRRSPPALQTCRCAQLAAPGAEQTTANIPGDEKITEARNLVRNRQAPQGSGRRARDHAARDPADSRGGAAGSHANPERHRPAARGGNKPARRWPAVERAAAVDPSSRTSSSAASQPGSARDGDLSARHKEAVASFSAAPQHDAAASAVQVADSARLHYCRQVTFCKSWRLTDAERRPSCVLVCFMPAAVSAHCYMTIRSQGVRGADVSRAASGWTVGRRAAAG